MSSGPMEPEQLHRPFLDSMVGSTTGVGDGLSAGLAGGADGEAVRPYFLTGGRVHDGVTAFETVYTLTTSGQSRRTGLSFEQRAIADLCRDPQSVAEISALLHIPLGVAMVLARDLVGDGLLDASAPTGDPTGDPELIMRLIHAVHGL
jgi:Protein of unknown function (DUF742)